MIGPSYPVNPSVCNAQRGAGGFSPPLCDRAVACLLSSSTVNFYSECAERTVGGEELDTCLNEYPGEVTN